MKDDPINTFADNIFVLAPSLEVARIMARELAEALAADMYRAASRALTEAGYEHYEVSNYAMPGARSRHNLVYWQLEPYLAFGNGAASFLRGERYGRPRDLEKYFAYVDALEAGERTYGLADDAEDEGGKAEDTETEQLEEALMLGLRLADGVDWAALEARHGAAALAPLRSTRCTSGSRAVSAARPILTRAGRPL